MSTLGTDPALTSTDAASGGRLTFRGLEIAYDCRVLEPRPWTQGQSAWAAELLAGLDAGPVLELCTGAGHIGLGAVVDSARTLVMVDASEAAVEQARANAAANGMADRVQVRHARLDEALEPGERFPLILADPPWVRSAETGRFPADPLLAIDGGDDGLDLARTCVDVIADHLAEGGSALLQLGTAAQADTIAAEAHERSGGRLRAPEVRTFEGGVVLRLVR